MIFKVWCEDYLQDYEDALDVNARDAREAAETWARDSDVRSAEYAIVEGTPATVKVWWVAGADAPAMEFVVSGETVAHYSARTVLPDKDE